jgi:hypothetical protein
VIAGRNAPEAAPCPAVGARALATTYRAMILQLGDTAPARGSCVTLATLGLPRPVTSGAVSARVADRRTG